MVNVYERDDVGDGRGRIIARVKYNQDLDYWDGSNWSCGSTGRHLGITRLRSGSMVLIYGTQWQGERDYGLIVTDDEALQAILDNAPDELDSWPHLKALSDKTIWEEGEGRTE